MTYAVRSFQVCGISRMSPASSISTLSKSRLYYKERQVDGKKRKAIRW